MSVTATAGRLSRRVTRWPRGSRLRAGSLAGISFGCGICAAVWFTAGTVPGMLAATAALAGCWLAQAGARRLALTSARPAARATAGWLTAGCGAAAEFAAYGGLAAGAPAGQLGRVWPLATAAVILLAFRQMAGLCQEPPGFRPPPAGPAGERPRGPRPAPAPAGVRWPAGPRGPAGRAGRLAGPARWLLGLPAGARMVLVGVTAPVWGPRVTFTVLLAAGGLAVLLTIGWPAAARASAAGLPGCRGDGPLARRAGWLVRGQLAPLPPVAAGLAATTLLAVVGLRGLSGVVTLAPAAAMMLAAPGAAHPHDGRLDWLVPPALQAGQYIYLAALGFAAGVPGPLTFMLVCVIALRHLDVAYRSRHRMGWRPRYAGAGLGWEGRMLVAGVAALLGAATFAYLVLTAYLGVLLGWICLSSWYLAQEGEHE